MQHKSKNASDSPFKRRKDRRRLGRRAHVPETHAIAQEDGQRDEACEPENHGDHLDDEDERAAHVAEFGVVHAVGEAPGHEDEEDEGEERPDGAEDEVGDLRGRAGVPVAGPPFRDCGRLSVNMFSASPRRSRTISREAQDDDGEDGLRDTQRQDDRPAGEVEAHDAVRAQRVAIVVEQKSVAVAPLRPSDYRSRRIDKPKRQKRAFRFPFRCRRVPVERLERVVGRRNANNNSALLLPHDTGKQGPRCRAWNILYRSTRSPVVAAAAAAIIEPSLTPVHVLKGRQQRP